MRRAFALISIAVTAWVGACVGSDPGSAGPTSDGGAGADAVADSGTADEDTGASADSAAEAAATFCATAPAGSFCDDFERPDSATQGSWGQKYESSATLTIIEEGGNRFLRATSPSGDAGSGGRGAYLHHGSAKTVSRATLSLRFRISGAGAVGAADSVMYFLLRRIILPNGVAYSAARNDYGTSALYTASTQPDGGPAIQNTSAMASGMMIDHWYAAKLEMFLADGVTKRARLYLDGFEVANLALGSEFQPGPVEAAVGIGFHGGPDPVVADVDDVVFEFAE